MSVGNSHVIEMGFEMNQEYWKEIEPSLALLNKSTGQTWEHEHTGGGCDSFTLNLPQGYYMITTANAGAPLLGEWHDVTVGWYTEDNYDGVIIDTLDTLESLTLYMFGHDMHGKDICPICGEYPNISIPHGCTCWFCGTCATTNPNRKIVCQCGAVKS